jgi:hypothetical protein
VPTSPSPVINVEAMIAPFPVIPFSLFPLTPRLEDCLGYRDLLGERLLDWKVCGGRTINDVSQ